MRIPSVGQIFVIWFWTLIALAVANYLFLLLAYDWRTYAVLGALSVIAYLFSRGPREHKPKGGQRGSYERSAYEPTLHRTRRSESGWED
jgi:membrane protein implicated in regulation of membrane protease activity